MGKKSFLLGGIIGFILGSRAGRSKYDKLKAVSQGLWNSAAVQHGVAKVEGTVGGVARTQACNLTDRVADRVKERIQGGQAELPDPSTSRSNPAPRREG